ncbi:hypothetical protein KFZ56_05945 [Virgibacillus sp. NKC19-3]|uniref:hypothetical protein n=1 Tax=Virgibacillus saliphilus TaxID=2831674 RepID=UPI001C9AEF2D|nr:hypothetical protein [Virgibacillus sp. NKC19-3]MBY7142626.1 hypothetical protein [Virgibacillus sp. NKC19-3]
MEKVFIMVAIVSFLLAVSLFIVEIVKNGYKNSNLKPALRLFIVYIVSVIAFLIVYNLGGK